MLSTARTHFSDFPNIIMTFKSGMKRLL